MFACLSPGASGLRGSSEHTRTASVSDEPHSERSRKGSRYLREGRDEFWGTDEAHLVRQTIKLELGHEINSVDGTYVYCLTKLKGHFDKRGIFVATSDLSRSLVALSVIAIVPICRIAFFDAAPLNRSLAILTLGTVGLATVAMRSWRRMNRYRRLSEATVFRAYLGLTRESYLDIRYLQIAVTAFSSPPPTRTHRFHWLFKSWSTRDKKQD